MSKYFRNPVYRVIILFWLAMLLEAPLVAQSTAYIYHALSPLFGVNNRGALPERQMNHGLKEEGYSKILNSR
ncbi:MAG: hypothetical protein Q7J35_14290 [Candidatus Methanoperedens sp.]|nr:hypothetical protein [Candidatus Methanoperedens sp.]